MVGGRTDKSIVENTYYVSDVENENGGKTTEQFSSGEVAWLLNGDVYKRQIQPCIPFTAPSIALSSFSAAVVNK